MSEQTVNNQELPAELSDILFVLDKEKKKIQAVKGIDKDGNPETADVTEKNQNQFIHVNPSGDLLSNFFSNFVSQLKNPTRFSFFNGPSNYAVEVAKELQKRVDSGTREMVEFLKKSELKAETQQKQNQQNSKDMETTTAYRYSVDQIDWEAASKMGITRERLEKLDLLDTLLRGFKTNDLVPINVNMGTASLRTDARLSLRQMEDGKVVLNAHGIRKEPELHFPFLGHTFTDEDKKNLLKSGNMGRIVELTNPKTQEKIPSIISVDHKTNELIALPAAWIKIRDEINGVQLDEKQKQTLMEGKPLYVEGMISRKGTPFNSEVQYSADKRYEEFLFGDRASIHQATKETRGKILTDEQHKKFNAGEAIYLKDMVTKDGRLYSGYLTFNRETGKDVYSRNNPNKAQDQSQSAGDGNTPKETNKQQQKQEKSKAPARSRARKM